jgi:hypothetical protein
MKEKEGFLIVIIGSTGNEHYPWGSCKVLDLFSKRAIL